MWLSPTNYKLIMSSFRRIFVPHTKALQTYVSMSREGECSLASGHGEIGGSKKDTMDVSTKPNLEAEIACVCNLKELLNLKATNVDVLALSEKKMTAQANLVAAQSKVIVAKCMLEKANRKFKKFGIS
jgi:hypothetical protein